MFFKKFHKGQSTLEYITLFLFIAFALLVFQKYILRALNGRWKSTGDSYGYGRQYDPVKTSECAYDYRFLNVWYDIKCYEYSCDCESILSNSTTCRDCISSCRTPECDS